MGQSRYAETVDFRDYSTRSAKGKITLNTKLVRVNKPLIDYLEAQAWITMKGNRSPSLPTVKRWQ